MGSVWVGYRGERTGLSVPLSPPRSSSFLRRSENGNAKAPIHPPLIADRSHLWSLSLTEGNRVVIGRVVRFRVDRGENGRRSPVQST